MPEATVRLGAKSRVEVSAVRKFLPQQARFPQALTVRNVTLTLLDRYNLVRGQEKPR